MKKDNTAFLIIVLLSICFLCLGFSLLKVMEVGYRKCSYTKVSGCNSCPIADKVENPTIAIKSVGKGNELFLYGNLKKESVPAELELGEYWYWLYFEKPILVVNNASGVPIYADKIQLVSPENSELYNLDSFADKRVEVYGYQTSGYAESSVFQVEAIREY
jgi:hypothetical protein